MSQDNQDQVQAQDEPQRDQEEEQQPEAWDWHFFDPSRPEHDERQLRARFYWHLIKDLFDKLKLLINSENDSDLLDIDEVITLLQNAYYDFKHVMTNPFVEKDGKFSKSKIHTKVGTTLSHLKRCRSSAYTALDNIHLLLPQKWCWLFDAERKFVLETIDGTFSALREMKNMADQGSLSIKQAFDTQKTLSLCFFAQIDLNIQRLGLIKKELDDINARAVCPIIKDSKTESMSMPYRECARKTHVVHFDLLLHICGWLQHTVNTLRGNASQRLKIALDRALDLVICDLKANICWDDMTTLKRDYNLDMEIIFLNLEVSLQHDWNALDDYKKGKTIWALSETMSALQVMRAMSANGTLTILQALDRDELYRLFDWSIHQLGIEEMNSLGLKFKHLLVLNPMPNKEKFKKIQDVHLDILFGLCEWIKDVFNEEELTKRHGHDKIKFTMQMVFKHMKAKLTWNDIQYLRRNNKLDLVTEVYEKVEHLLLLDLHPTQHDGKKKFVVDRLADIVYHIGGMQKMKYKQDLKISYGLDTDELKKMCEQLEPVINATGWSEDLKIKAQETLINIDKHLTAALALGDAEGDILKKRLFMPSYRRMDNLRKNVEEMKNNFRDDSLLENYKFLGDLTVELKEFEGTRYEHPDSSDLVSREDQESRIPKKWCEFCRYVWRYEKVHTNGSMGSKIAISYWGKPQAISPVDNSPLDFQPAFPRLQTIQGADLTPRVTPSGMPAKYARLSQPTAKRRTAVSETECDHGENDDPDHSSLSVDLSNADSDDSSSGVFSSSTDLSESLSTSLYSSMPSSPELPKPETSQIVERFTTAGEQYRKMLADVGRIEENEPVVVTGEASTPGDVDRIEEVLTGEASTLRDAGRMAGKKPAGDVSDRSSTTVSETKSKHKLKKERKEKKAEKRKTKSKKRSAGEKVKAELEKNVRESEG